MWHYGPVWIDIQDTQRPRAVAAVFSGKLNHKQGLREGLSNQWNLSENTPRLKELYPSYLWCNTEYVKTTCRAACKTFKHVIAMQCRLAMW